MRRPSQSLIGIKVDRAFIHGGRHSAVGRSCTPCHARGDPQTVHISSVEPRVLALGARTLGPAAADDGASVRCDSGHCRDNGASSGGYGTRNSIRAGHGANAMKLLSGMQRHHIGKIICALAMLVAANSVVATQVSTGPEKYRLTGGAQLLCRARRQRFRSW